MLLSKDDLWEVISEQQPEDESSVSWNKRDRQAKATISLLVEDDQLIHIRKEDTARRMWQALQKVHEHSNLTSKLYLLRKIHQMRFQQGQNMQMHITTMLETVKRLCGLGEDMKDNYVASMLLCSLPESYRTLITALEARSESDLSLEFVCSKILDEYQHRMESSKQSDGALDSVLKTKEEKYCKSWRPGSQSEERTETFS